MIKTRKELLEEIANDVLKNSVSREVELEHLLKYRFKKAKKMKDKELKKQHLDAIENRKQELENEQEEREDVQKILKKMLR